MISKNFKKRLITSIILLLLIILMMISNFFLIFTLIVLGVLSVLEFLKLTQKIVKRKLYYFTINLVFLIYLSAFCFLFFFFSNFPQTKIILFLILSGCISSDIGGYIFGKTFKGPKLTKISPNKTYSGMFGSIFLTLLIFSTIIFYLTNSLSYKIILYALTTSISCQIGDLVFSYLKRKAKLKDTGDFFPGHGGVLDRIDGVLLGMPIGFISMLLL